MTSESEKSKEKKQNQLQRRLQELNTNYNFFLSSRSKVKTYSEQIRSKCLIEPEKLIFYDKDAEPHKKLAKNTDKIFQEAIRSNQNFKKMTGQPSSANFSGWRLGSGA